MYDDYYTTLGEVERQEGNSGIDEENENQLGTLFLYSLGGHSPLFALVSHTTLALSLTMLSSYIKFQSS